MENNIGWKTCVAVVILFMVALWLHNLSCESNYEKLSTKLDDIKTLLEEPIETNFKINP